MSQFITFSSLGYTRQVPTETGWYWLRESGNIDQIIYFPENQIPFISVLDVEIRNGKYQFAGPIPIPRDLEPDSCQPETPELISDDRLVKLIDSTHLVVKILLDQNSVEGATKEVFCTSFDILRCLKELQDRRKAL